MKRLALILSFAVCSTLQARIGETIAECESRYGAVVERRPATISGSDAQACVFSKQGITIVAEFKDGKAWRIAYRMSGMTDESVAALLEKEAGNSQWSAPLKIAGQEIRTSSDHQRVAIFTPAKRIEDMANMVFASKECAKATHADYEAKLTKVPEIVKQRIAAKPLKDL